MGVFNSVNQDVYQFRENPNALKLDYSGNDLNLWAKHRDINISKPKIFPVNSVKAMRGCLFAMQQNCLPLFAQKVFDAYWGRGLDISDEAIIMRDCRRGGIIPSRFQAIHLFSRGKRFAYEQLSTAHRKKRIWFSNFFLSGSNVLW